MLAVYILDDLDMKVYFLGNLLDLMQLSRLSTFIN